MVTYLLGGSVHITRSTTSSEAFYGYFKTTLSEYIVKSEFAKDGNKHVYPGGNGSYVS